MLSEAGAIEGPGTRPVVAVVMQDQADLDVMRHSIDILHEAGVECLGWYGWSEAGLPGLALFLTTFSESLEVLICSARGDGSFPQQLASVTTLPILSVPLPQAEKMNIDTLVAAAALPRGVAVGTFAIGKAGATNAGLEAIAILALHRPELGPWLGEYRRKQTETVLAAKLER